MLQRVYKIMHQTYSHSNPHRPFPSIKNLALQGWMKFFSATYRLFKLSNLEPDCEDYGQSVIYKGTASETQKYAFKLDDHHVFLKGKFL